MTDEFLQEYTPAKQDWIHEFTFHQPTQDAFSDLEHIYQQHTTSMPWSDEFYEGGTPSSELSEEEQILFEHSLHRIDWEKEFANVEQAPVPIEWPEESTQPTVPVIEKTWNAHIDTLHFKPYQLNPSTKEQEIIPCSIDTTLEAKHWEQVGLRQQENEQDAAAILALEKAVALDATCLDAWLALSVSYTNEHRRLNAYHCLEQWIAHHASYKHILQPQEKQHTTEHAYMISIFLKAACIAPTGERMDPDVQVGLGILFNMSEEYEKSMDCFKSALDKRPDDYQLWNKVGATLANARNYTEAMEMYLTALEINPSFVRARYNLAISLMNLGRYQEAAQHLLTTLDFQRTVNDTIPIETSIWDTLRLLMYM